MDKQTRIAEIRARLEELDKKETKIRSNQKKTQEKIGKYEKDNKILFLGHKGKEYLGTYGKWDTNSLQKQIMAAFKDPEYKVFVYSGANRIGKTFLGIILTIGVLLGHLPWEDPKVVGYWIWELRGWSPPIKIRILGQDWEKHVKTVIVATLKELWPKSIPIESRKNNNSVEAIWTHANGTIEIMSNNQESALFEGWKGHWIYYDEPVKRENRVACARGLIDYCGIELFCMTLLSEAWIDREVVHARTDDGKIDTSVKVVNGEIYANLGHGITKEGIEQFAKTLTEDEKNARLRGIPSYRSTLVFTIDRSLHVVERFEIPSHYIIDVAIDIGSTKPHEVSYLATTPMGEKYVCFEQTVVGNGEQIADSIIKKKHRYNLRINRVICDPLAKSSQKTEVSTWEQIDMHLNRYGHVLEAGSKFKDDGVLQIKNHLKTVHNKPALFFFSDCAKTIDQLTYIKKDYIESRATMVVSKKDPDDYFENLYRLMLLDTKWFDENEYTDYEYQSSNSQSIYGTMH